MHRADPPATLNLDWHRALRRYLILMGASNLIWEFAHLPLYTVWGEEAWGPIIEAVLHCTAGDLMIAALTLLVALLILGNASWPAERYWRVAGCAVVLGLLYTGYSEWVNVYQRGAWRYAPAMPLVPGVKVGLSPLLQWLLLPVAAFVLARRS